MSGKLLAVVVIATVGCLGPATKEINPPADPAAAAGLPAAGRPTVRVCVIEDGELAAVTAIIDPVTGDTLVSGQLWREAYPATLPPYARDAPWLAREIIRLDGRYYAPHGPVQVIERELLKRAGEFRGVPIFAEADLAAEIPDAIFVPVRPGCEFQPYVANVDVM